MHEAIGLKDVLEWTMPVMLGVIVWYVRRIAERIETLTTGLAVETSERRAYERLCEQRHTALVREVHGHLNA